jgi:hypothetical protein
MLLGLSFLCHFNKGQKLSNEMTREFPRTMLPRAQ